MIRYTLYICMLLFAPSILWGQEGRINFAKQIKIENGTAANVAIPVGAVDRGLYSDGTNLNLSVGGGVKAIFSKDGDLTLGALYSNTLINTPYHSNFNQNAIYGRNFGDNQYISSTVLGNTVMGSNNFNSVRGGYYSAVVGYNNYNRLKDLNSVYAFGTNNGNELLNEAGYTTVNNLLFGNNHLIHAKTAQFTNVFSSFFGYRLHNSYNTTKIGGYYEDGMLINSNNNIFINSGYGFDLPPNPETFTITSVNLTTQEITINTPLPTAFVGAKNVLVISNTSGTFPAPLVANTGYEFTVINTTTIKWIGGTLTGTQTGGMFKRYVDNVTNTIAIGDSYTGSNQLNFGNYNHNTFSLSNKTTNFDISKKSYSILDQDKAWLYDNSLGKFTPKAVPNIYNNDGTLTSQRLIYNPSNYDQYWYGQGAVTFGVSGSVAKFDINNTVTGRTALNVKGINASFLVDNAGGGINASRGISTEFSNFINTVKYAEINTNGISITPTGSAANPALRLGNVATGFYGNSSDLSMTISGTQRYNFSSTSDFTVSSPTGEYYANVNLNAGGELYRLIGFKENGLWIDAPANRNVKMRFGSSERLNVDSSTTTIGSGYAGHSGLKFSNINSSTAATAQAAGLGVDATGKVVVTGKQKQLLTIQVDSIDGGFDNNIEIVVPQYLQGAKITRVECNYKGTETNKTFALRVFQVGTGNVYNSGTVSFTGGITSITPNFQLPNVAHPNIRLEGNVASVGSGGTYIRFYDRFYIVVEFEK